MRRLYFPRHCPRHRGGFTLLELMVTVAIVAILGALAIPSLRIFLVRNHFSSIGNEFQGSVFRARSEAVSKNICTTMCMSDTVDAAVPFCKQSENNWQVGWMVFINPTCDANYGNKAKKIAVADLIFVRRTGDPNYSILAQRSTPIRRFTFNTQGNSGMGSLERFDLEYISTPLTLEYGFNICLDAMGRTRSIPGTKDCTY